MTGTCLSYRRASGWGFVTPDDQSLPNVFVHYSDIQANAAKKLLIPGERVEFELDITSDAEGKPRARNVVRLSLKQQGGAQ